MDSGGKDGSACSSAARKVRREERQARERWVERDCGELFRRRVSSPGG